MSWFETKNTLKIFFLHIISYIHEINCKTCDRDVIIDFHRMRFRNRNGFLTTKNLAAYSYFPRSLLAG